MSSKTPVRATLSGSNVTGLAEYQSGEFVPLSHGGLGAALSIGSAGQVLKVNGAGNAIEFGAVEAIVNIDNATDLESATLAVGDKILLSDGGTEGRVLLSQLDTLFSGTTKTLTNKTLTTPVISEIDSGADILLDATGDVILDAGGKDIIFRYGGSQFALFTYSGGDLLLQSGTTTALTFDGANVTSAGNVTVGGNLTVNGSTTTVNSTNTTLDDNLLELNSGATSNANDTGIIMERGSTGDNAIIAWDESEDKFIVGTTTATASDTGNLSITTGTLVGNIEGNLTGNVTGNVSGSSGSTTGNAATATTAAALTTGRTIGMTGDVVWTSASFDGSGNVTGVAALQANTVSSTELVSAVTLEIVDSGGTTVKTIIGAGS